MSGQLVYTTVDDSNDPGSQTELFGVNSSGDIVGAVLDVNGEHSFVTGPGLTPTIFDVAGSTLSEAHSINDGGDIVGFDFDDSVAYSANLNNLGGAAAISVIPAGGEATAIDNNGAIVGFFPGTNVEFNVVDGNYLTVNPAPSYDVFWDSVSASGTYAIIDSEPAGGEIQTLLATPTSAGGGPLNFPAGAEGTGVNDSGQVVLNYVDGSGQQIGLPRDSDGSLFAIEIPNATATWAEGINDSGEIVGYYDDAEHNMHGFTTTVSAVEQAATVTACYCRGTLIGGEHGDVPVEALAIGDKVLTKSGALRPIKWIGWRSYGGRFVIGREDILPICIKAGALDNNVPRRDLWISPHHAMFVDGALIEARDLINGVSIVQAKHIDTVSYFHIELETHDVIVAEGAWSETFMDDDSRGMFQNAQDYAALYPDAATRPAQYYAQRLDDGYELAAIQRRIALRAGVRKPDTASDAGALRGFIDLVTPSVIAGWAQNTRHPETPVCLDIVVGGRLIGQVLADRYRPDLQDAGIGNGSHAFEFDIPAGIDLTGGVEVRRSFDGVALVPSTACPLNSARFAAA
jgi:hypothetical protein